MMRNTTPVAGDPASAASVERRAQNAAAVDPLPPSLGDDLLRGAEAIAAFLFGDPKLRRKVYYLTGDATIRMPHFKLGSVICARKTTLLRWIADKEGRH
jgi:hypothetical protein